ncbi:lipoprotein, putative [Parvularcula bermudensis HTCC2503]|uniref:Lipoprotein, putative n=1 Tax=Parvularcula bermudensis (strain ATCC BAA-594 / HTCC2503 / KCTC 12087) TaxID=314260 RepID=E0TEJ9_PARBH|nr:DUF3299 domain-containing protein [Parvularcula bermudensis]ADM10471.1 lipoprotein, putative [Parvularcula bermudensis HTCC2503]
MNLQLLAFSLFVVAELAGFRGAASGPGEGSAASQQAVRVLEWDDLLPEGEEDRLDRMYADYYRELERRMKGSQAPLSSAAGPIGNIGGSIGGIEEGSSFDVMPQIGTYDTVSELDGRTVRLPGFVVPFDFDAKGRLRNFLFVPYFGACIHTPPPPPNQIVYVEGETSISVDDIWVPYWAEGVLHAKRNENDIGNAAYTLVLRKLEPYEG